MKFSKISNNEKETELIAKELSHLLSGKVVFLVGAIGAGKTTFIKYLAKYLGFEPVVYSPTFSIANIYEDEDKKLIHFDLYRVESEEELEMTGFYDMVSEKNATVAIEWADKFDIKRYLKNVVEIKFTKTEDENTRRIEIL